MEPKEVELRSIVDEHCHHELELGFWFSSCVCVYIILCVYIIIIIFNSVGIGSVVLAILTKLWINGNKPCGLAG